MRTTSYRFPPSCPLKDGFPPTNAAMETQRKETVFQIPARFENPASFGMPLHTGLAHFGVEMPGFIAPASSYRNFDGTIAASVVSLCKAPCGIAPRHDVLLCRHARVLLNEWRRIGIVLAVAWGIGVSIFTWQSAEVLINDTQSLLQLHLQARRRRPLWGAVARSRSGHLARRTRARSGDFCPFP